MIMSCKKGDSEKMSHSGNYMDGVPVKISEKYKPPPRIELPNNVVRNISTAEVRVNECSYDFSFETNVLCKLKELQTAKETIKAERRHRLQLLRDAKQKQLDLIAAAEAEEKLRQLNVSDVSYPSAEEISEISPEEKLTEQTHSQSIDVDSPEVKPEDTVSISNANFFTYPQNVLTTEQTDPSILKPILLTSNAKSAPQNLLDDPDPLKEILDNAKAYKMLQLRTYGNKNNVDTMSFSDFENDTSSPFDNMELKTINDIELLAQVLNTQQDKTIYESQPSVDFCTSLQDGGYSFAQPAYTNCHTANDPYALPTVYHNHGEMMTTSHVTPYNGGPHYTSNGYYGSNNDQLSNTTQLPNVSNYVVPEYTNSSNTYSDRLSMYQNNYQTMDSNFYRSHTTNYADNTKLPCHIPISESYSNAYLPHTQYFNYDIQNISQPPVVPTLQAIIENTTDNIKSDETPFVVQSRSRSVPDIVRELDEEIRISRFKAQQRSQNSSPASNLPSTSQMEVKKIKRSSQTERLMNPYNKLSENSQQMCDNISGMGFPMDRVARACILIGENDKKIIEYLLVLGELLDLGFNETKVSEALVKNEFNRDKALDELVA